jgi:hypothetical protein
MTCYSRSWVSNSLNRTNITVLNMVSLAECLPGLRYKCNDWKYNLVNIEPLLVVPRLTAHLLESDKVQAQAK